MLAKPRLHSSREAQAEGVNRANNEFMFAPGRRHRRHRRARSAFTLVEILVVMGIILLLMALLVPSLSTARSHSKATACLTNLKSIGLAFEQYRNDNGGTYPPSYVYPTDMSGSWTPHRQDPKATYGILHWSSLVFDGPHPDPSLFQCPEFPKGGAPRTNPGREASDWEAGQLGGNGLTGPEDGALTDWQAPRMSYAANAAVIPPNRFTEDLSGGQRVNMLVAEHVIRSPGKVILATEYLNDWKALSKPAGDGFISEAHRPIDAFANTASGYDEYTAPSSGGAFVHGTFPADPSYGLLSARDLRGKTDLLALNPSVSGVNAVGRSHPTSNREYNDEYGGGANFLFVDSHAELLPVLKTLQSREWGDRYYSISGSNEVIDPNQASAVANNTD